MASSSHLCWQVSACSSTYSYPETYTSRWTRPSGTPLNRPLEPTQLFESAVELANFFFLMWLLKRRKFDGQVFGAFLFIYGVARFFLEFLRDDPGRGSVFGGVMTGTQLISIGLVIGGGLIWWLRPESKPVPAHASAR